MKRLLLISVLVTALAVGTAYKAPALDPLNLPTAYDLVMLAGADYILSVQIKDSTGSLVDFSSATHAAQFRSGYAPAGVLFANLSTITRIPTFTRYSSVRFTNYSSPPFGNYSGLEPPAFEIISSIRTRQEALVTFYPPVLDIKLSRAQTVKLSGKSGLWDLKQTVNGLVTYLLSGKGTVRPTVTQ